MISLLEIIFQISGLVLFACAFYYFFHFKKRKKERKLTPVELSVYTVTQISLFLVGSTYILLLLDKNY